jgi:uncharacterized protein
MNLRPIDATCGLKPVLQTERRLSRLARGLLLLCLQTYKLTVSPVLHWLAGPGAGCRFDPTCSEYARDAVQRLGVCRGGWLALHRLCRCHPWGDCGHDPVPEIEHGP